MGNNAGTRHFEYKDDKSSKFWEISPTGNGFTVRYGKIGTEGQTQTKEFADTATTENQAQKLIAEKVGKGYQEVSLMGASIRTDSQVNEKGSRPIKASPEAKKSIRLTKAIETQRQRINEAMSILDPILTDKNVSESTKTRIRFVLDVTQPTYYFGLKEAPPKDMNRLGNMVGGWPYTSEKYPWPGGNDPYPPFLQLNLKDISCYSNTDLGEGLLQVWATHGSSIIRVIEPEDLESPPSNDYFDTGILKMGEDNPDSFEQLDVEGMPHARRNSVIVMDKPKPTVIPYFDTHSEYDLDDLDLSKDHHALIEKVISIVDRYFPKFPHLYFFGAHKFIQCGYGCYINKCVEEGWRPLLALFSDGEDFEFGFDGNGYLLYRIVDSKTEFFFYWDR